MASRTNQVTWSDHDSKWNLCDSIWNRRKGGSVEVILDQKDLGITNRLRRSQGRPNRTRSIATRFTPDEEQELKRQLQRDGGSSRSGRARSCSAMREPAASMRLSSPQLSRCGWS